MPPDIRAHNCDRFKELAHLRPGLTPDLDELASHTEKQRGDVTWLKAFNVLGT